MRKALLDLKRNWLATKEQTERLETVRAINNLPHAITASPA
jgi:hypothetical protein